MNEPAPQLRAAHNRWPAVPRVLWEPSSSALLIVCPHPDDEVLGCGGLVLRQRAAGRHVEVLACTDGEAAYPSRLPGELAEQRRREHREALLHLGVEPSAMVRLGLPDGRLERHESNLVEIVGATLDRLPEDTLVVAPWLADGHPDHDACGRAAELATRDRSPLVSMVIWGWFREGPVTMSDHELLEFRLTEDEIRRRHAALEHHRSQLVSEGDEPILGASYLPVWLQSSELYLSARTGP